MNADKMLFLILPTARTGGAGTIKTAEKGSRGKTAAIISLYVDSGVDFCLGRGAGHNPAWRPATSLSVLNTRVPGFVFGLLIAFLGIRYFMSVRTLSRDVFKQECVFSWQNFKRGSAAKK